MLTELFVTACTLSVIASKWLNNDDGELTSGRGSFRLTADDDQRPAVIGCRIAVDPV